MTNYFANALRSYLDRTGTKSSALEREAGVPLSTIAKLLMGHRPSIDRLAELLRVIPGDEAAELLRAYLLDDVPENWRHAVTIIVQALSTDTAAHTLQETPAKPDSLTSAITRLRRAAESDISLTQWLIDTADLIVPHREGRATSPPSAPAQDSP